MLTVRVAVAVRQLVARRNSVINRRLSGAESETGRHGTIDELAAAERISSSYVSRLMRLTLLAPEIVEAILDGRQPEGVTLPGLMKPFPVEWWKQQDLRRSPSPPPPNPLIGGPNECRTS